MPIYHRTYSPGELQFITSSTYRRAQVFRSSRFCQCFVERLEEVWQKMNCLLVGWVLMGEWFLTPFSHEVGTGKEGCCTLEFTYNWNSSTGNLTDLSVCSIGEYVTSSLGTGTQNWPYPMVEQATYPIINPFISTSGTDSDTHLPPDSFYTPYSAASFTDTQIYRYQCPGVNGGNWVTLAGPYTITRSVSQTSGVWQYKITKADGSLTHNLP